LGTTSNGDVKSSSANVCSRINPRLRAFSFSGIFSSGRTRFRIAMVLTLFGGCVCWPSGEASSHCTIRGRLSVRTLAADPGLQSAIPQDTITISPMAKTQYVYSFKSAVGTFWIRPERNKRWGLYIGGEGIVELLGCFDSPYDAADDVHMQRIGWDEWDRRMDNDAPATLLLWTRRLVR
jgi:hypothetical protein